MLEAKRYPIRVGKGAVTWESEVHSKDLNTPVDILGFTYSGKEETIVMDRRVIGMFRDRLKSLEEENESLRDKVRIMELLIVGLIAAILLLVWLLAGFLQIYP